MKQTAVEWLMEEYINGLSINLQIMKKALEMEKEQIIDAFEFAWYEWAEMTPNVAENYYNETFKQQENETDSI